MPAAAVIPAPIAYIKVVAVKKLVVGFWDRDSGRPQACTGVSVLLPGEYFCPSLGGDRIQAVYFEKIRVFKAGLCLEYVSME